MSEFTPIHAASGGTPPRPGGKMKLNKKTIAIYGGLAVAAFVLISNLFKGNNSGSSEAGGTTVEDYPNPMNSADVQSQLQNYQSIVDGQLETGLTQIGTDLYNDQQSYKDSLAELMAAQKADYEAKLKAQTDAFTVFKGADDKDDAAQQAKIDAQAKAIAELQKKAAATVKAPAKTPAKTPTKPPAKTPAKPPAKTISAKQKLINLIDASYKGGSIVDYLKSAGRGTSMTERKKIAATLGIKNYTGTAAQNTQMLKLLRSDGK